MASQQLKEQTHVNPQQFDYLDGDWILPTPENQRAELVDATTVEAGAAKTLLDTSKDLKVKISFDLLKPTSNFGWGPKSRLAIRAMLGDNGKYQDKPINQKYVDLAPNVTKTFEHHFLLEGNHEGTNDEKLHFALVDETTEEKGGLVLLGATLTFDLP